MGEVKNFIKKINTKKQNKLERENNLSIVKLEDIPENVEYTMTEFNCLKRVGTKVHFYKKLICDKYPNIGINIPGFNVETSSIIKP